MLEGRDRIGGRAFTDASTFKRPFDQGCHWLHSPEENPLTRIAETHGFVVAREAAHGGIYDGGCRLPPDEERAALEFRDRTFAAIRRAGAGGAGVPVTLRARVRRIDMTGARLRVESDAGTAEAPLVLVTVSTGVLRAEAIPFAPRLPDWKLRALEGVPMARALKVGLEFSRDVTGIAGPAFLTATAGRGGDSTPAGARGGDAATSAARNRDAMDVEIWPAGWNGVTCYLDGDLARRLEEAGGRAVEDFALDALAGLFGSSIRAALVTFARTGWNRDELTRGTYSAARPGHAGARAVLGRPLDDRVHFAGEATSISWSGDLHGAYQSGLDAADAMLGRARVQPV